MARQLAATAASLALALFAACAAADTYLIDPVHSQPMFEVRHMGFSIQRGSFGKATGKITLDRAAKTGSVDVTIDTTSIRTIDPRLDERVRGEDFFNVARYPTMSFKSNRVNFDGDRVASVDGELTLIGVTRPVTLTVTDFACGEHPSNNRSMCGAEATTTIKRSEWGMKYGVPKSVGDDVRITLPVEAYRE
jgi:polyisoprenoid-binding protein YceI